MTADDSYDAIKHAFDGKRIREDLAYLDRVDPLPRLVFTRKPRRRTCKARTALGLALPSHVAPHVQDCTITVNGKRLPSVMVAAPDSIRFFSEDS